MAGDLESPSLVPQGMREERKVVTAVFADVVGSTPLAERLDPEEVRLIVGEAVARMVHAVEEYGGTVKDLAGDGVLALFGAPATHEDDPERAVRAGLDIAQSIADYGRQVASAWGVESFSVRVGVATGPVVVGAVGAGRRIEYGAFGDTVNVAARLQSVASPGTVLVEADTRRLVEPLFEWGPPRDLDLKGRSDRVVAWEASGVHVRARKVRGVQGIQAPLVGRRGELATAREGLEDVLGGSGSPKLRPMTDAAVSTEWHWGVSRSIRARITFSTVSGMSRPTS